jgi:outer membrane protein OmpA-like peptidoglycan-associated protein
VNGKPTPLPVVHARGRLGDLECEFFFLDDVNNPLTIKFSIGENRQQVVRIEFPFGAASAAAKAPRTIQQQLESTGKAEIYGIYFDFSSDHLKEESEPVLTEIATVLGDNPAWTLRVDGHTDSIGGDASNFDLSKRRAAAVKQALVSRYKIPPARLTTNGFGASRPKDTNDTLEGRARNRRVELTRQ